MYEKILPQRLAQLREQKNISAREMSLSIGQNSSYINRIENGKAFPSMQVFFYICEYLCVTPCEFFDIGVKNPEKINRIIENMSKLNDSQLDNISSIVEGLIK